MRAARRYSRKANRYIGCSSATCGTILGSGRAARRSTAGGPPARSVARSYCEELEWSAYNVFDRRMRAAYRGSVTMGGNLLAAAFWYAAKSSFDDDHAEIRRTCADKLTGKVSSTFDQQSAVWGSTAE